MMTDLHGLVREVTLPPGAAAWYGDAAAAPPAVVVRTADEVRALVAQRPAVVEIAGDTGLEIYRLAALAARLLRPAGGRVRVRWGPALGIKAATLALLFGADELVGDLATHEISRRIAIIGGPPEDPARPTRSHVEALIRAAGRTPERMS